MSKTDRTEIKKLDYREYCPKCTEVTGPFLYNCVDNTNPENTGTYEFFGTVANDTVLLVNNAILPTRRARRVVGYLYQVVRNNLMYCNKLVITKDTTTYYWTHEATPAECLVLEFTFNNDEKGKPIEPFKLVAGNDTKLPIIGGQLHLVDKFGISPNSVNYGYDTSEEELDPDEPPLLDAKQLQELIAAKQDSIATEQRNNRLL